MCNFKAGSKDDRLQLWGTPEKPVDLYRVFEQFIDGAVNRLPWCENAIQLETVPLKEQLKKLNRFGFLTINSQPRVNGVASTDSAVGWGGPGGYVYQKAYFEFFCSANNVAKIQKMADEFPGLTYTAVNFKGEKITNLKLGEKTVNAVTWGVFPNREIVQPTVVDVDSFLVWKDEAFALWLSQWQPLYEQGTAAWDLIQEVHDTYFLVNVVDNDYMKDSVLDFFEKIMA